MVYNKQKNIFVSILCKAKRSILLWQQKISGAVKPLFSNDIRSNEYITLNKNDILIRNEYKIANIFFKLFFFYMIPNLGIKMDQLYLNNVSNIFDPAKNILVYLFLIKWYHLLKIKLVSFKRNKTNRHKQSKHRQWYANKIY